MHFEAVLDRSGVKPIQGRNLTLVARDDHLPADVVWDAVLLAEGNHRCVPLPAELRLERSGFVIDSGMNDAAVASGLVSREAVFLFENRHCGNSETAPLSAMAVDNPTMPPPITT